MQVIKELGVVILGGVVIMLATLCQYGQVWDHYLRPLAALFS